MDPRDTEEYVQRYEGRLAEFGYSPETLGWGKNSRQDLRFSVLGELALESGTGSVLDVGCGFGDLYEFLTSRGWCGEYLGIDLVPGLVTIARERHPNLEFREADIADNATYHPADFVIASGVFNGRLTSAQNQTHIQNALRNMHRNARIATCVDFLTSYVDFQKPGSWHTDPAWAFGIAKTLSKRVALRHDYFPYEFALIIFANDRISGRNVFEGIEDAP